MEDVGRYKKQGGWKRREGDRRRAKYKFFGQVIPGHAMRQLTM